MTELRDLNTVILECVDPEFLGTAHVTQWRPTKHHCAPRRAIAHAGTNFVDETVLTRDQFAGFFARSDTFALGVCNGCQMLSHLRELIPGADYWPRFLRNSSEQFEARLSLVEVLESPSLFLEGMAGSRLPIATSHGEGRVEFSSEMDRFSSSYTIAVRYVDNYGRVTDKYPANPNGSHDGICGLANEDGRVTIMMPHPERVARTMQNSWHPDEWGEDGPWLRMFRNARVAVN